MLFPVTTAWTPTAVSQSPSRTFKTFLSAIALWQVSWWFILVNNFFIENVPAVMLKENRIKCIDPDPELATKLYDANKSMYVDRLGNRIFRKYNCDSHNEKLRGVPEYDWATKQCKSKFNR